MSGVEEVLARIATECMPTFPEKCIECPFWEKTSTEKMMCRAPIAERRLCKLQRLDKAAEELIFSMPEKVDGGAEFAEVRVDKLRQLGIVQGMKDF